MKRFSFRLETLLRHRLALENLREHAFAVAQSRHVEAARKLDSLAAQHREAAAGRPVAGGGMRLDAPAIQSREQYLSTLQAQMAQQEERVEVARLIAEEMCAALVAARQAREAVTRLRDKDFARHQIEMQKLTQLGIDEVASMRFAREQSENSIRRAETAARSRPDPDFSTSESGKAN